MGGHALPVAGAVVVLGLLLVYPPFGLLALVVALVVAIARWMFRPGSRPCLRCGQRVTNGVLECPHCGFDFRTIGAPSPESERVR